MGSKLKFFAAILAVAGGTWFVHESKTHLSWDFSKSHDISVVGWPKDYPSTIWYTPQHQVIDLVLPSGRKATYDDVEAEVVRTDQAVRLVFIRFNPERLQEELNRADSTTHSTDSSSLDDACSRASNLMNEWGLSGEQELQAWHEKIRTARLEVMHMDDCNFQFPPRTDRTAKVWVHVHWTRVARIYRVELEHLITEPTTK